MDILAYKDNLVLIISIIILFSLSWRLYLTERRLALKFFTYAWLFYLLRFPGELVRLKSLYIYSFFITLNIVSAMFILGAVYFIAYKRVISKKLLIISSIVALLVNEVLAFNFNIFFVRLITFTVTGVIYIISGMMILQKRRKGDVGSLWMGIIFVAWGIHKFNYPFWIENPFFKSLGFTIAAIFSLIISISLIAYIYERKRFYLYEYAANMKHAFDNSQIGIAILKNGRIIDYNKSFERLLGIYGSAQGRALLDFVSSKYRSSVSRILNMDIPVRHDAFEVLPEIGTRKILEFMLWDFETDEGEKLNVMILYDITERRSRENVLHTVYNIVVNLPMFYGSIEDFLRKLVEILYRFMNLQLVFLARCEKGKMKVIKNIRPGSGYLDKVEIRCDETKLGMGPTGLAMKNNTIEIINDILVSKTFSIWLKDAFGFNFRSVCAIPFIFEDEKYVITLFSSEINYFSGELLLFIRFLWIYARANIEHVLKALSNDLLSRNTKLVIAEKDGSILYKNFKHKIDNILNLKDGDRIKKGKHIYEVKIYNEHALIFIELKDVTKEHFGILLDRIRTKIFSFMEREIEEIFAFIFEILSEIIEVKYFEWNRQNGGIYQFGSIDEDKMHDIIVFRHRIRALNNEYSVRLDYRMKYALSEEMLTRSLKEIFEKALLINFVNRIIFVVKGLAGKRAVVFEITDEAGRKVIDWSSDLPIKEGNLMQHFLLYQNFIYKLKNTDRYFILIQERISGNLTVTIGFDVTELLKTEKSKAKYESMQDYMLLFSAFSHELKNLLNEIVSLSEQKENARLKKLLRNMKEFLSRIRVPNQDLPLGPINIGREIRNVIKTYSILARKKGVKIRTKNIKRSIYVKSNETALNLILSNLLTNSIKYGAKTITISMDVSKKIASIDIIDDGPGIPQRFISGLEEGILTPIRDSKKGLGLFLVRMLAMRIGASFEIVTELNKGTRVRLSFPIFHIDAASVESVLVLDDNLLFRENLAKFLMAHGFKASLYPNVEQVYNYIKEEKFDIIITDLMIGAYKDSEIIERILHINPEQKIIIISGMDLPYLEKVKQYFNKNVVAVFEKPINFQDIVKFLLFLQKNVENK